jgi:hypothetical protein
MCTSPTHGITGRRAAEPVLALCDEVDRVRAERDALRRPIPKQHREALAEIADPANGYYSHHAAAARYVLRRFTTDNNKKENQ